MKLVKENLKESLEFKRGKDPIRALKLGYKNKPQRKAWKILEFIKSKGEEGATLKEIQEFIYFELAGAPYGKDWFYEKEDVEIYSEKTGKSYPSSARKTRGYQTTGLYGARTYNSKRKQHQKIQGLLPTYCEKNDKRKWVFKKWPEPGANIYLRDV